ncbi:MAG: DUF1330 domain-containing protein [Gammaproteobacteria bacterium]|nr:DUF1330 domain-containing protein [Gammaproteobacteria bacterium]
MAQIGYSLAFARDMVPAKMKPYSSSLPPIYEKYRGGYVGIGATGRGVDVLAGDWGNRSIMLGRFPGPEAVAEFWWSPEYRAAAKLREGAVRVDACKLAGAEPRANDSIFLVVAFRPASGGSAESLLQAIDERADEQSSVLVAAPPDAVEVLEGEALAGCGVLIFGYESPASLTSDWTTLSVLFETHGVTAQAYSLARLSPPA